MPESEIDRIHERYRRRTQSYEPWVPWVWQTRQELERAVIRALLRAGMLPAHRRTLLDVGCGAGGNLLSFLRLGFQPEHVVGAELQQERAAAARRFLPQQVQVLCGDASELALEPETFDVVFQSLVFSSILDDGFQQRLAERMWRLTAPGGGVLWYDFTWDNPSNPDVRGVTVGRVKQLFPDGEIASRRVTLAPPLSRRVTAVHPSLYGVFNVFSPLRTHVLCWIAKRR